jgi:hypothetical protein
MIKKITVNKWMVSIQIKKSVLQTSFVLLKKTIDKHTLTMV